MSQTHSISAPEPLLQDEESAWDFDIQSKAEDEIGEIVSDLVAKRRRERDRQENIDTEARVRDLLNKTKPLLAVSPSRASLLLEEVHYTLRYDDDHRAALRNLEEAFPEKSNQIRSSFKAHCRRRDATGSGRRSRHPNPEQEYQVLAHLGIALGYFTDPADMTKYAPVTMESLADVKGAKGAYDPSEVGIRRLKTSTTQTPESAAVEIAHEDCDHILAIAKPRSGKDSTLVSIGHNLWKEHGYSYFSIFDDGRMETPMTAIPNDEQVIQDNLERMGQEPDPFDAEVFVPRTESVPDKLPANFREFTIGIDSLTPFLILRLSGVKTSDETAEDRIRQALEKTRLNSGQIDELVYRIKDLAEGQDATITWTEKVDEHKEGGSTEVREVQYKMDQSKALRKAAQRLGTLASRGIVAGKDAITNISMEKILKNQHKAAVLCTNFMPDGAEPLKYTITDLWLRLIFNARDEYSRAPRACIEIRELKNLAPSKLADTNYADQIKSLRQTIFKIASQGGSRRVQMLGSTQKLNDVYKSVRSNMSVEILMRLGDEEIKTLSDSYDFSFEERQQLKEFDPGQGMIAYGGDRYWPIQFRGAPCGLGLGDLHWLDRYGTARGCRVNWPVDNEGMGEAERRWSRNHGDEDWWVHVPTATVRDASEPPEIGDYYSEWHLLASDIDEFLPDAATISREAVDGNEDLIDAVLEWRRPYELRSDISLQIDASDRTKRDVTLISGQTESERLEDVLDRHSVTPGLRDWVVTENGSVRASHLIDRWSKALKAVTECDVQTLDDMAEKAGAKRSNLSNETSEEGMIGRCINKSGEYYTLNDLGEEALATDWDEILEEVHEADG